MSKLSPNAPDDVLARLTEAFVEQSVPDGPEESAKQRLLVRLGQAAAGPPEVVPLRFGKGSVMRKVVSVAAAALVVVGIGVLLIPQSKGPSAAFAAMLDRVQAARTAKFRMAVEIKPEGEADEKLVSEMTSMEPAWLRGEATLYGVRTTSVTDFNQRKSLVLFPDTKLAKLSEKTGRVLQNRNYIEALRKLNPADAEYAGEEVVDGVKTLKYLSQKDGDYYTIWISAETNLPVRYEYRDHQNPSNAKARMTMSSFEWDVPVDASQFSLELPAGYEWME